MRTVIKLRIMNIEQLEEWQDEAMSDIKREIERLQERGRRMGGYLQVMEATSELYGRIKELTEDVDKKQHEIDNLEEQVESLEAEVTELRQKLLEAQNKHLEAEKQHLADEVKAKPAEIHNHFGAGSNSQVFNDKVEGKFTKQVKKVKKDKKDKKQAIIYLFRQKKRLKR